MYYLTQRKTFLNDFKIADKPKGRYKLRIRLLVPAQEAKAVAPLSPTLGQFGLSTADFCKRFNEESSKYIAGMVLTVYLDVLFDRTFNFHIHQLSFVQLMYSCSEGGAVSGFLTSLEVYQLAFVYTSIFGGTLRSNLKTILGTLRGSSIRLSIG